MNPFNNAWLFLKNDLPSYLSDLKQNFQDYKQGDPGGLFYEGIDPRLQRQLGPIPDAQQLMNMKRDLKPHEIELLRRYYETPRRGSERVRPTPEVTEPYEEEDWEGELTGNMRQSPNKAERFGTMKNPTLNPGYYNQYLQDEETAQQNKCLYCDRQAELNMGTDDQECLQCNNERMTRNAELAQQRFPQERSHLGLTEEERSYGLGNMLE